MIYLDNAATTLHKPKEVQEAVIAAFGQMGNSGRGASEPALKALGTVYDAREALARLFMPKMRVRLCLPQILQRR